MINEETALQFNQGSVINIDNFENILFYVTQLLSITAGFMGFKVLFDKRVATKKIQKVKLDGFTITTASCIIFSGSKLILSCSTIKQY